MSQGSTKKRRPSLQIGLQVALICFAVSITGCGQIQTKENGHVNNTVHTSSGAHAKTLRYLKTIDVVGIGSNDAIKRFIAGQDSHDLNRPVAIDVRGNTMIIAESGRMDVKRGITVAEPDYGISDAGLRVVDQAVGVIFRYDLTTGRMKILNGVGDHIKGDVSDVYLASDNSFYLTDVEGRRALHFSPTGKLLKVYKHPPNIFRPIAITVDEQRQEVLIADETYSHVVSFDMKKAEPIYGMGGRGNGPGNFRIITDMIAIPDGFLVSDRIELRVQVLDREGNFVAEFGRKEVVFPTALAVDIEGRVFVSDKSDSTIKVFKAGKLIDTVGRNGYGAGEFRYISDMKVKENKLYVVDSLNGRIQVFEFIPESASVKNSSAIDGSASDSNAIVAKMSQ